MILTNTAANHISTAGNDKRDFSAPIVVRTKRWRLWKEQSAVIFDRKSRFFQETVMGLGNRKGRVNPV